MAQRGGNVVTYVRIGDKVHSPLVENGQADVVLAFEQLEALRALPEMVTDLEECRKLLERPLPIFPTLL